MFQNRIEAGKRLAQKIKKEISAKDLEKAIILALPRGGVVTGAEAAKELKIPLDIIITRKIGALFNPEYAIAAVSKNELIINPRENPEPTYLQEEAKKQREEIFRREKVFRQGRAAPYLENKIVILIDDGLATGLTMKAAILEVKKQKAKTVIVAVPVAPPDTVSEIFKMVDKIIFLDTPEPFFALGQFYQDFPQVSDEEVVKILKDSRIIVI